MKDFVKRSSLIFALIVAFVHFLSAQIPVNYYSSPEGKTGATLKTALYGIINNHTQLSYADLWTVFKTTDARDDGKVWDMYSNC